LLVFTTELEKNNFKKSNNTKEYLLTIKEFENNVVQLNKDFKHIDETRRIMFLKKATEFQEFKKIDLSHQDFYLFINDLKTLLSFYQELSVENVDIENIISYVKEHDIYLNYEKHLKILLKTLKNYLKILEEKKYVDLINIRNFSKLNEKYIKSFNRIIIHYTGYITEYDFSLFKEVSKITSLKVSLNLSEYDKKNINKLNVYFDTSFENGNYLLNFSDFTYIKYDNKDKDIYIYLNTSPTQINETLFLFKMLNILKNEKKEDIGIIVNDNSIIDLIELSTKYEFNFIRKETLSNNKYYIYLNKVFEIFKHKEFEKLNEELKRKNNLFLTRILNEKIISLDDLKYIEKNYKSKNFDHINIVNLIKNIISDKLENNIKIRLNNILDSIIENKEYLNFSFMEQFWFILNEIKDMNLSVSIDGYNVYHLLETRFLKFKHTIILDFNEKEIPIKSKKDLFLNSDVRENLGIPTYKDRANLQKHYYYELFNNSQNIYISSLENDENSKSKFLLNFDFEYVDFDNDNLNNYLFKNKKNFENKNFNDEIIIEDIDLAKNRLSSTKLNSYLTCKRQYYYKYIKKIKEPSFSIEIEKGNEFGILFHSILNEIYKSFKKDCFTEENLYKEIKKRMINSETSENILYKFNNDLWDLKIKKFVKFEIERLKMGVEFFDSELSLEIEYRGIKLYGQIDRIDIFNGSYVLLDYKTGKYTLYSDRTIDNAIDFQLEFYYLLVKEKLGEVGFVGYYDLKNVDIVHERFLNQKIELLNDKIDQFKEKTQNFSLTENKNNCFFCKYKDICSRN